MIMATNGKARAFPLIVMKISTIMHVCVYVKEKEESKENKKREMMVATDKYQ